MSLTSAVFKPRSSRHPLHRRRENPLLSRLVGTTMGSGLRRGMLVSSPDPRRSSAAGWWTFLPARPELPQLRPTLLGEPGPPGPEPSPLSPLPPARRSSCSPRHRRPQAAPSPLNLPMRRVCDRDKACTLLVDRPTMTKAAAAVITTKSSQNQASIWGETHQKLHLKTPPLDRQSNSSGRRRVIDVDADLQSASSDYLSRPVEGKAGAVKRRTLQNPGRRCRRR